MVRVARARARADPPQARRRAARPGRRARPPPRRGGREAHRPRARRGARRRRHVRLLRPGPALDLHGDACSQPVPDALGLALREPVGVVGVIITWNFPLALLAWKLGPALAAGCTVVVKPSPLPPATALDTGRILLELGLPPGVFNVVTSEAENGAVAGGALVGSPLVDKIAFTGSGPTG